MDGVADRLSLAPFLALLDKIPAALWVADRQLNLRMVAGVSDAGLTGQPVSALFASSKDKDCAILAHQTAIHGIGGNFNLEMDGRDMQVYIEPLREPDGVIGGVAGLAVDVTGRQVTETALRLSEQSYRSLVEEAPYGICRATDSGQLLQVNPAMLAMLGYEPAAEADLLVRDLPLIFVSAQSFFAFRRQLLDGGAIRGIESTWIRRDGQPIQVRLGGRAIRNTAGEILYFDLVAEDVTERKELEARLFQAEKMQAIGQLAGGVAHDFNNLLTVICGQVEFLLENPVDGAARRRLEDVKQAADRAAVLTRQLLAFSRRQVLQSKVVDLNSLIERAQRMLSRLVREDIEFTFKPGRRLGLVRTDPHQIEQVLMNLVVNAQDAMPQGGNLTIETGNVNVKTDDRGMEPGQYIMLVIRDTGHGMDPETQSRIFEPFFTTKEIGKGTGLGLATVYGVVKQCGGHIQVESHPGKGTTFYIYLPRVEQPVTEEQAAVRTVSPGGSETILVAEDEAPVREPIVMYLKRLGYRVLAAPDGVTALDTARKHSEPIHLLLSDLVLPGMGGRELAEILGKTSDSMKIIFVSGYAGHSVAGKDLDFPDAHFLSKPFSMHGLAVAVREVLDGPGERVNPEA